MKTIYREPKGIGRLAWTVPVWATDSALSIQDRLLSMVLLGRAHLPVYFPSERHRQMLFAFIRARSFDELLYVCSGESLDFLIKLSHCWDKHIDYGDILAMRRTVYYYWRMQQSCMRLLEQATKCWTGSHR